MSHKRTGEEQYLELCKRILNEGVMIENERTGHGCLTVINEDFEYDVSNGRFPLLTTRKAFWRQAIAEIVGYLRGYDNAYQFAEIGCNTWFVNANKTKAWLENPHRKGDGDMGRAYGVQARAWVKPDGGTVDQLRKVIDNLSRGIDDRAEIISFYNPGEFHLSCLRPCMFMHHFSILDGTLYQTSYSRSVDVPIGLVFNAPQAVFLLRVMAQITGLRPGSVYHKLVNNHLYDNQIYLMREQVTREPFPEPTLHITDKLKTLEDLETWFDPRNPEHIWVEGYEHHPRIDYPFAE